MQAGKVSKTLSKSLLESLIEEFSTPDTLGVGLVGSFSRGEGKRFSDVDLDFFLPETPPRGLEGYSLHHRWGHLISLKYIGLEDQRAELYQPQDTIWAVPGMQQMQILSDPQGLLAGLKAEAEAFCWEPLTEKANAYVSYQLMHTVEEVYKILGGLEEQNPSKVIYATLGLGLGLASAMAVHKRLLIASENQYFELLYQTLGKESPWSRAHRLAVGWRAGAFERRGIAALQLYWESFMECQGIVADQPLGVIQPALIALQESGYLEVRV